MEWPTPWGDERGADEIVGVTGDDRQTVTRWVGPRGCSVRVHSRRSLRELVEVDLEGAAASHVRVAGEQLVVCDDRGRVLALDRTTGAVLWQRRS